MESYLLIWLPNTWVKLMRMGVSVWTVVASVCLAAKEVAPSWCQDSDLLSSGHNQWCNSTSIPHTEHKRNLLDRPEWGYNFFLANLTRICNKSSIAPTVWQNKAGSIKTLTSLWILIKREAVAVGPEGEGKWKAPLTITTQHKSHI